MGILDKVAEIAGAVAAVEAEKKLNPESSLLAEGVAAVLGYKGGGKLASLAEDEFGATQADAPSNAPSDAQATDSQA